MGSPPIFQTGTNFDSADFGVQGKTDQKERFSLLFRLRLGKERCAKADKDTDLLF
jgi:hypothetical protein